MVIIGTSTWPPYLQKIYPTSMPDQDLNFDWIIRAELQELSKFPFQLPYCSLFYGRAAFPEQVKYRTA
jgi:hypothetical protein